MMINKNEKGQAALVFIFGMIAFLGFAGLAIDGGRLYSEHRSIQALADNVALTAAMVISQHDETITEAIKNQAKAAADARALENGFLVPVSKCISDSTYCVEIYPHTLAAEGTGQFGRYYIVDVYIRKTIPAHLIQMVWDGDLDTIGKAQVKVTARSNAGFGQAMVSLKKGNSDCQDNSMKFSGSGTTTINGSIYNMTNCPDGTLVNNVAAQGIINGTTTMVGGY
ncbi:MAG: Tad domain-containing protein, partial [Anaerolineae bacterium]|nr:Tad domain-containing protein [Anaerolineae bacterium]